MSLVLGLATVMTVAGAPAALAADSAYIMGYFKESPSGAGNVNAVHFAVSKDGLEWIPLNNNQAILTPTLGTKGIRDPFLFRLTNGSWVLVATDICNGCNFAAPNPNIHIWTSADLVNWSTERLLKVNTANPNSYTWAPAIHWDASRNRYGITFSGKPVGVDREVIYVVYTSDFVSTSSPQVFFDEGGAGVIDSHVITGVGGYNYLYYRSDNSQKLVGARSTSVNPGSFVPHTSGVSNGCTEAPTLVKSLTSSTWWLWGDTYCPNGVLYAWQGDIASGSWSLVNQQTYTPPLNAKHNTIQTISGTDYDRLLGKYGGTTQWNRLKSWNFPGHYLRHANNSARIDAYPFDPFQSSQWKIVPGLADSAGVSFRSVTNTAQYLRHSNFNIVLGTNDNSALFRADATFYKVAGLANGSWSSFRSYNYPTRYIRHYNFALYLQPISGSVAQADATFRVGF
jgi:hypothetical protein